MQAPHGNTAQASEQQRRQALRGTTREATSRVAEAERRQKKQDRSGPRELREAPRPGSRGVRAQRFATVRPGPCAHHRTGRGRWSGRGEADHQRLRLGSVQRAPVELLDRLRGLLHAAHPDESRGELLARCPVDPGHHSDLEHGSVGDEARAEFACRRSGSQAPDVDVVRRYRLRLVVPRLGGPVVAQRGAHADHGAPAAAPVHPLHGLLRLVDGSVLEEGALPVPLVPQGHDGAAAVLLEEIPDTRDIDVPWQPADVEVAMARTHGCAA